MADMTDRYGVQRKTPSKKTKTYERPGLSEEEIEVRLSPCCCVTYSLLTRVLSLGRKSVRCGSEHCTGTSPEPVRISNAPLRSRRPSISSILMAPAPLTRRSRLWPCACSC